MSRGGEDVGGIDRGAVAFAPGESVLAAGVRAYAQALAAYRTGAMDAAAFRALRIQAGVHLERSPSSRYMVRVKTPYGLADAGQLRALAAASRHGLPRLHLTTRQAVELHDVPQEHTVSLLAELAEAGLTTWNAGGNSVRNIVACPLMGTCPLQRFDAIASARALARDFLGYAPAEHLPRKLKVALSGCERDCAAARLADVGLVAEVRDGQAGFRVFAGGGIGATPAIAVPLAAWVPAAAVTPLVRAVADVFGRLGNRQNRHRGRLKWLVAEMGEERFRSEVARALEQVGAGVVWTGDAGPKAPEPPEPDAPTTVPGVDAGWARSRLRAEVGGTWAVVLPWPGGSVTPDAARTVADWSEAYGAGVVTVTTAQELVIRGVRPSRLGDLYAAIGALMPEQLLATAQVVSCPGAPYCNLAVTRSGDLAQRIADALRAEARRTGLADPQGLLVRVSGCPHSCSHARFAPVGLIGGAVRLGRRSIPAYTLLVGGAEDREQPVAATATVRVPARRVPEAIVRIVRAYRAERDPDETFAAWTARRLVRAHSRRKEHERHE